MTCRGRIGNALRVACLGLIVTLGISAAQGAAPCADCPQYEMVQRTICVPVVEMQRKTVTQVVCRPETRTRTITVTKRVPETHTVERTVTVMVPKRRTRTETYTACKPVWETVTEQYTVAVPHRETRSGTRTVCKPTRETQMRTVCRDHGHWETQVCDSCCPRGCAGHKVWVPKMVTEEVPVTVWKTEMVEQPYQYSVVVCRPEVRTRQRRVVHYEYEQRTRNVAYFECVPETRTQKCNVVTYRCVPEEREVRYTVMVPETVQREVMVPVCKMVEKTITCRVPVAPPCCCPRCR